MSLRYAILTSLGDRPASGWELAHRFGRSIGFFWQASHQQIYRELRRLQADGLLDVREADGRRGPRRKIYALTPKGSAELRHWLRQPPAPPVVRDELLVKIFGGWQLDDDELLCLIARAQRIHRERLDEYRSLEADLEPRAASSRRARFALWTLRRGILEQQTWLAWLDDLHDQLTTHCG